MGAESRSRKNPRLEGFDYSRSGMYFITICTLGKEHILCRIFPAKLGSMEPKIEMLNPGVVAEEYVRKIPGIDRYVIMPNHIHLLIQNGKNRNISRIIQFFKANVTRKLGRSIFQDRFYDHIIRDEKDYLIKAKYIEDNPAKWADDDFYHRIPEV